MDIFSLIATGTGMPADESISQVHLVRTPRSSSNNVGQSSSNTPPRTPTTQTPPRPNLSGENDMHMLSTSPVPVQQRLARARTKRQQILTERIQHIDNKCKEREYLANMRHMDTTLSKVSKARVIDELILQAKSKREHLLEERVAQIAVKLKRKESGASKRKEDMTLQRVERARTELAKSPIAKKRREQQLLLRVQRAEATLQSKTARAQERFERHLMEKQQRACCMERKERAELRRGLICYENRARILATLDAKLEGAAFRNHKYNEEKTIKAGEDIVKAKEVARRVKAARDLQSFVRRAYGMKSPNTCCIKLDLSQNDAAQRLQTWSQWKLHVCKSRFFGANINATQPTTDAFKALGHIVKMFPQVYEKKELGRMPPQPPPFELLTQMMMMPEALKMAALVIGCMQSISGDNSSSMDGRTLLAICLIAIYPREVLGDDSIGNEPIHTDESNEDKAARGSRLLALSCRSLLDALHQLVQATSASASASASDAERVLILKRISSLSLQSRTLFDFWKSMDKRNLLDGLSTQLEQSWVVFLTSSEALRYLAQVSGVDHVDKGDAKTNDPLLSLRLRHEASKSGSCSHIKRIRLSLNKLIGVEEGKEFVSKAKTIALKYIEETNAVGDLKGEIDEFYLPSASTHASSTTDSLASVNSSDAARSEGIPVELPAEIMSNRMLVHKILLTEPCDFGNLSWDGTSAQLPNASPDEFIAPFAQPTSCNDERNVPVRIAQTLRLAFFHQIASDLEQNNYGPVQNLITELHAKMRSLLPSRKDLHSHIDDHDASLCSSVSDIIRVVIRFGSLLATYFESPARAPTTLELIDCLKEFNAHSCTDNDHKLIIPYGIKSEELFAVASIAYILHKADFCQLDVCNHKLQQAAPLVHLVGHEYEREHFQKTHGDYHSSTIAELQQMLPSTWNWVQSMQILVNGSSSSLITYPSFDQNIEIVKGIGFVDGLLFTRSQTLIPELLSFDVENILHIRSEARCCVIASALALHACNISRVGTSVLSSTSLSDDVLGARRVLSSVLRNTHYEQTHLECIVIEAVVILTKGALPSSMDSWYTPTSCFSH
jgi:hypothetical protein